MKTPVAVDRFELGVCYYPEQWPEKMWDEDFRRMAETGFTIVRMGEFAWSIFEPEEGDYQFGLFDRAIDLAHSHGLKVVLGTPTATPPAWLTERYPEVLNVSYDGVTLQHGMRRHYNYSSPKYRELCARIVTRLTEHYANYHGVVGWQIDNELNCETNVFYSESDHQAFREWLQHKYGTLEKLNEAWGTVFWNQTYNSWSQLHLPRPTPVPKQPNPHQALDEIRFISDNTISFAKVQADIIRNKAPKQWITTNGLFGHLDNHEMTDKLLDFYSYDSYPQFSSLSTNPSEKNPIGDRGWSLSLSTVRSISPNFCIMEQQSGPGGWVNRMDMPSPKPGQMRLWTYQSVAHGADMILYFRWRTATMGHEIYWHGINDYHNQPNRRVREAIQIGQELASSGKEIIGTRPQATVAILRDYDNEWDGEYDVWHGPFMWQSNKEWFKALTHQHIPNDVFYLRDHTTLSELSRYEVLIYPHPAILSDETARLLDMYVQQGGKLVFGCRTGYKDKRGHCYIRPFPGAARELCGITIEEFTRIKGTRATTFMNWGQDPQDLTEADSFNEILHIEDESAEVIATYASDYYAGKPAITRNVRGKGEVWYYGAVFNEEAALKLSNLLKLRSPAADWLELPREVELQIREGKSTSLTFLLNYSEEPAMIKLKDQKTDLLTGATISGTFTMDGFGVLVLK